VAVGIQVTLRVAGAIVRGIADPAGGHFDAAGDFDRALPRGDARFPLLGAIDAHGDTCLVAHQMPDLIGEIQQLIGQVGDASAIRGLDRLRVLARRCHVGGGELMFEGD
jgi:hypothetical protein